MNDKKVIVDEKTLRILFNAACKSEGINPDDKEYLFNDLKKMLNL